MAQMPKYGKSGPKSPKSRAFRFVPLVWIALHIGLPTMPHLLWDDKHEANYAKISQLDPDEFKFSQPISDLICVVMAIKTIGIWDMAHPKQ